MIDSGFPDETDEPKIEVQARICPVCIDDHSSDRECRTRDLIERIRNLENEIERMMRIDYWHEKFLEAKRENC